MLVTTGVHWRNRMMDGAHSKNGFQTMLQSLRGKIYRQRNGVLGIDDMLRDVILSHDARSWYYLGRKDDSARR